MNAKGPVFKYGDNIATDVIIPARYLNTQSEAALAVSKIDGTLPVEEIIKLALRSMAGRR